MSYKKLIILLFLTLISCQSPIKARNPTLIEAITKGDLLTTEQLLNEIPQDDLYIYLQQAFESNQHDIVKLILNKRPRSDASSSNIDPNRPNHRTIDDTVTSYPSAPDSITTLSETEQLVLDAVIKGDDVTLTKLLADNTVNINKIWEGGTYLRRAIQNKQITITQILLDQGASLDISDSYGNTPLHYAVHNIDILELLLSRIHSNSELLNTQNESGETPLHYAYDKRESLIALLEHGANPLIKNNLGETVRDIIKDLVNDPHILSKTKDKYLAIDKLLQKWEHQFIQILSQPIIALIAIQLPTNSRALQKITPPREDYSEKADIYRYECLDYHNWPTKPFCRVTPLSETEQLILDAVQQGNDNALEALLTENTVDINKILPDGDTYLHVAIMNKQITTAQILLDRRASLQISDSHCDTPLHYAVHNIDMLKLLLQHISKNDELLNRQNASGYTPLHCAYDKKESLIALLEHGANPFIRNRLGKTIHNVIENFINGPCTLDNVEKRNSYLAIDKILQEAEQRWTNNLSQSIIARINPAQQLSSYSDNRLTRIQQKAFYQKSWK